MPRAWSAGLLVMACACTAAPPSDASVGLDVVVHPDAPATPDAASLDAPDTSPDAICPAYDAHARECFGEGTGEDFLAECRAIYEGCGGTYPAVVRCRLETACADLGVCAGLGC